MVVITHTTKSRAALSPRQRCGLFSLSAQRDGCVCLVGLEEQLHGKTTDTGENQMNYPESWHLHPKSRCFSTKTHLELEAFPCQLLLESKRNIATSVRSCKDEVLELFVSSSRFAKIAREAGEQSAPLRRDVLRSFF